MRAFAIDDVAISPVLVAEADEGVTEQFEAVLNTLAGGLGAQS